MIMQKMTTMEIKQSIFKLPSLYVNKNMIKLFGINTSILAADLLSKQFYFDAQTGLTDGFFFNTADNIEDTTGLSYKQQKPAISKLIGLGIVEVRKYGIPARLFFKVNPERYKDVCDGSINSVELYIEKPKLPSIVNSDEEMKEVFLSLFNRLKEDVTGQKGLTRALSKTDMNNLKTLAASGYGITEFSQAIIAMLNADWPKKTGNQTPSHVLRVDNFNRYLNISNKPIENKQQSYGEY